MSISQLLQQLVAFPSVTPSDAGCNDFMIDQLKELGFRCTTVNEGPVSNFFARIGEGSPLLVFAGHTDVVPIGDQKKWNTNPFELSIDGDIAYGRGTADMKGSLASMLIMCQRFLQAYPQMKGSIGFLITSAEEGDDFALGTPLLMDYLKKQGIQIDYCIVGEPSSSERIGDVIKVGRRGSLTASVELHGKQGHVAYPHLAQNPIHLLAPVLKELAEKHWDHGNEWFPPTSLQVTALQSGGHSGNIIPGDAHMAFNFRYSNEQNAEGLQQQVESIFAKHGLHPHIEWLHNGEPFLTNQGNLLSTSIDAIESVTGKKPECSTSGGTSDGRFIAPHQVEVVEIGPINASIHQVNECVSLSDLERLADIYFKIAEQLVL